MNYKYTFYFQEHNTLFSGPALSICHKASQDEISHFCIVQHGDGIFIHLPQEGQGWGLHYKLAELELQVSGRDQEGKYVGEKSRDEAQKILTGNKSF